MGDVEFSNSPVLDRLASVSFHHHITLCCYLCDHFDSSGVGFVLASHDCWKINCKTEFKWRGRLHSQ